MNDTLNRLMTRGMCGALTAVGLALAGAPAYAQTVDEITVMGRLGPDGAVQSLSRMVSYVDLDLTVEADADALKMRVKDAAKDLCRELGENHPSTPLTPSCEKSAQEDAMKQVRMAMSNAVPRPRAAMTVEEPMVAPASMPMADVAPAATAVASDVSTVTPQPATFTTTTVTNGPVPDTAENRARFGGPLSRAGQHTTAAGN